MTGDEVDDIIAEQRGMDDQRAGKPFRANPYRSARERDWWDMGWIFAKSEEPCSCSLR